MYIGIDLGGTNIAIGLVDDNGKILKKGSRPTIATRPYIDIVKDMAELSGEVAAAAGFTMKDVDGIGIGCPGTIDNENGVVIYANNLNWNNAKIREELQKYYDLPVNIENDANAAAYGEYAINGNNAESFIAITLGTGVGGGIVIDNKIYRGFNG
ncbi:MAG: ROK family protein, partial [Oscillospiraceae bacterium]